MCVCFRSWMFCIYVERCFESLICWLDLCLSSLLFAFISLCFFLFEKLIFFMLNGFSIDPRQIPFYRAPLSSFLDRSYRILDPSRFLGFFSIDSRQLLRSIKKLSVWPIDSRHILDPLRYFWRRQILDNTLTDSFLLRFSAWQILRSIKLRFPYIVWVQIRFIFHFFLSIENLFSHPKHFSLTQNLLPLCSSA